MEKKFIDFIEKMQAISKIGLTFSKDPYALENYQEISDLSAEMLKDFANIDFDRPNYFYRDIYPTPSISVRTVCFNEKKEVLFVQEANSGTWSLPGGWCDINDTPSVAAKKECMQEAGADVELLRLVGLTDRTRYKKSNNLSEYVIIFEGRVLSPLKGHCHETLQAQWFPMNQLPPLSRKTSNEEIQRFIDAAFNKETIFD